MFTSHFEFVTQWKVEGTQEEVFQILDNPLDFVRWWPAVWLRTEKLEAGSPDGVGRVVRMVSKGWLPYVLDWTARVVEKEFPRRIVLHAEGDFDGTGCWTIGVDGDEVSVRYVWAIDARKPLLRYSAFILRPVFAANHRWAMARGEESLRLELARRRAKGAAERTRIPDPPGPVLLSQRRRRRLGLAARR